MATLDNTPQLSEQGDWADDASEEAANAADVPASDGPTGEHGAEFMQKQAMVGGTSQLQMLGMLVIKVLQVIGLSCTRICGITVHIGG